MVRPDRAGESPILVIVERDLAAGANFAEVDARHVGPKAKRRPGEELPVRRQTGQVDGDRSARADIEAVIIAVPLAVSELIADLIVIEQRRWSVGCDAQRVGADASVAVVQFWVGTDVEIVGPRRRHGKDNARIPP